MSDNDEGFEAGEGTCLSETADAVLVAIDGTDRELWVPKSVLHDDSEIHEKDDTGMLVVASWWAREKGL